MERKYNSSIRFDSPGEVNGHFLEIKLTYEQPVTEEDYESMLSAYQNIFSHKAGRQVPYEEISVKPEIGELTEVGTCFISKLESPLYCGLMGIHSRAPYALPKLIGELKNYQREKKLRHMDGKLLQHVVNGLTDIVEPKSKLNSLVRRIPFRKGSKYE